MIQFIACDMDGTLLNDKKELSDKSRNYIEQLTKKGIRFALASGRSREGICGYFQGLSCAMVTDNGARAYTEEGQALFCDGIAYEDTIKVMKYIDDIEYMHYFVVGDQYVYVRKSEPEQFLTEAQYYFYPPIIATDNWEEVFSSDQIIKFAINTGWDGSNEEKGLRLIKSLPCSENYSMVLSGDGWVELMKAGVSKGNALRRLCGYYGISMDEIMVFGDYLNDLNMLEITPNSYAMINGHEKVKKFCNHVTEYTNNEDGVIRELEKFF
ncbi:MAG: HAD family hydrolase [Anaerobutyricum sp.]|nr:HAD family hydrolase [Anaerobutyricum sp.]